MTLCKFRVTGEVGAPKTWKRNVVWAFGRLLRCCRDESWLVVVTQQRMGRKQFFIKQLVWGVFAERLFSLFFQNCFEWKL